MRRDPWAFGARPRDDGVEFRVWAPGRSSLDVVVESGPRAGTRHPLEKDGDGFFTQWIDGLGAGDLYRYLLDGEGPFPDPASRFQPHGVHGPSEVVDPAAFAWSDAHWSGLSLPRLALYELHVGTFTDEGTFAAARERLPQLLDLGITAVELMPVADFPGDRNWGYDGVDLFAPARCYGRPDDLRALVDRAHELGLGIVLDVVYNHFGPDGNYLSAFSPEFFSARHQTPWGAAVNLDGPSSAAVREFFIANALHWIREYHVDGLRLDATHALIDEGPVHFLAELSARVGEESRTATPPSGARRDDAEVAGAPVLLIAEDHRNLAAMVRSRRAGGWGLDALWADDFHHQMRRRLAGDSEGYYRDFSGSTADLASTLRQGWFYCGQHSETFAAPRGTDPAGLPPFRFVICLQNHDQIGNRAFGERLHHQVDAAAYRAATALLLLAPQIPLLFMGQEWGATSPFLYFTDHQPALGAEVTKGRRQEFRHFAAFRDPEIRRRIPDPQDIATFRASHLRWGERDDPGHAELLRLHRALLHLRQAELWGETTAAAGFTVEAVDADTIVLLRETGGAASYLVVARLAGRGAPDLAQVPALCGRSWQVILGTEDGAFAADPRPPRIDVSAVAPVIAFARPGAVVLQAPASGSRS